MTLTYAIKEGFVYTRRSETGTQDPVVTLRADAAPAATSRC